MIKMVFNRSKQSCIMKNQSFAKFVAILWVASTPFALPAAVQVWDPDGTTPGTGISGNWDTVIANWTTAPDAGGNTTWIQGNDAIFNMASNYTVTVTQAITVGS